MKTAKISTCEARVMQALRAGPMNTSELLDRFPGGLRIARLLKIGYVENDAAGYKLTELGRSQCPTRRSIEKAAYLPPANATVAMPVKPITTKPTIKVEAAMPPHTNVAKQIRDIITEHPGIEHKALIAKITNNSANFDETTKAANMISYVLKQGGFKKIDDHLVGSLEKVKLYYTDEAYSKRKQAAQLAVEKNIPTLEQHHQAKNYGTDNVAEAAAAPAIVDAAEIDNQTKVDAVSFQTGFDAASVKEPSALDIQEGGDHYKRMKIQPVQYILANNIGFAEGNVIKYVSRWRNKNGIEDLKKARHFLDILIEQAAA
jgi:hypothetical protein